MALSDDNDMAAINDIMSDKEEGEVEENDIDNGDADANNHQSNWVRRSTRPCNSPTIIAAPVAPTDNKEEEEEGETNATKLAPPAAAAAAVGEQQNNPKHDHNKWDKAKKPVAPNNKEDSAKAAPPPVTAIEENNNPKHHQKRYKAKKLNRDDVQLFAFDGGIEENTSSGRPKRKLKCVARFDSSSFEHAQKTNKCKAGHGFTCPRCSNVCSYDSKLCAVCSLECYYEAGVGVVVLKERHDVSVSPKKRGRDKVAASNNNGALQADHYGKRNDRGKKSEVGKKGAKRGRPRTARAKSPPRATTSNGGPSHTIGGKSIGGKGKRLLSQAPTADDIATMNHHDAATMNESSTTAGGGGGPKARPVLSLYERRPFIIKEFPSLDDARKDIGASCKTIREKRNYNQEHNHAKKRNKGKFMHYDFRDANDTRTARRWQRELLAVQHADFGECDNLTDARAYPSWPRHLADAHYRLCMGRRILNFIRRWGDGGRGSGSQHQQHNMGGGGKLALMAQQGFSVDMSMPQHLENTASREFTEDAGEDEAAKNAIVASIRGKPASTTTTTTNHLSDEALQLQNSAAALEGALDHLSEEAHLQNSAAALEVGALDTDDVLGHHAHDLGHHFGGAESEEHDMNIVNELSLDFPPEDHPPDIANMTTDESEDLTARLQESAQTLQTVTEEKKDIQSKYDSLLTNSIKTEEELRDTISTLMRPIHERGDTSTSSASNNQIFELENQLSAASTERDDLAKKVEAMTVVQSEKDELARKLEEANAKLEARENIEKENATNNAKEKESLKQQVGEATSRITELTEQLSSKSAEQADVVKKLLSATSDLSSSRETAETRAIKITQLESSVESLTTQCDTANLRVTELLSGNENADGVLSSLMSERDKLASSVEDARKAIALLETEKVGAAAKATSLGDTAEELQGRIESLSAELNASKCQIKASTVKISNLESDQKKREDESVRSNFEDREATYKSTIANLEDSIKQQNEEAHVLNETITTSDVRVADLVSQVSKLTADKDELATKIEEATSELSTLQSTFETLNDERDAAEAKVRELLSGNAHTEEVMAALNSEKEVLIAKIEECIARLYSEKDDSPSTPNGSDAELDRNSESPVNGIRSSRIGMNGSSSPIEKLEKQLVDKDVEVSKLTKDKEKLEAYTKQTLQIFQQKYFATTQDYKAQLKEGRKKIEALEIELENKKTT